MSLAQRGEFGLIARLRQQARQFDGVEIGIGDDCAALRLPPDELLLVTSDLLLEGVHFRRDWTDPASLGAKAVAVNLSDIAAMGGRPRYLVLGLGLPEAFPLGDLDPLLNGFLQAAEAAGVALVGGDTCRAEQFLSLAVTAHGTIAPERLVRRGGGRPGDLLYVSGSLGDAALALRQLQKGCRPDKLLADALHRPQAQLGLGQALAGGDLASAMIDISDGLLADLGHLLAEGALGAELELDRIPLSKPFAAALAANPAQLDLALAGGEDYQLLFSVPPSLAARAEQVAADERVPIRCIGRLTENAGTVVLRRQDGTEHPLPEAGFRHF